MSIFERADDATRSLTESENQTLGKICIVFARSRLTKTEIDNVLDAMRDLNEILPEK